MSCDACFPTTAATASGRTALHRKGVAAAGTAAGNRDVQNCSGDCASLRHCYSCAFSDYRRRRSRVSVHVGRCRFGNECLACRRVDFLCRRGDLLLSKLHWAIRAVTMQYKFDVNDTRCAVFSPFQCNIIYMLGCCKR